MLELVYIEYTEENCWMLELVYIEYTEEMFSCEVPEAKIGIFFENTRYR
jgi:hypothetical protein